MKDVTIKKTIEIDVPLYWERHPDPKYDDVRKKIYTRWALVKYFTGKIAEEWLWEADSGLYKDGSLGFLEATKALENAVEAIATRLAKNKLSLSQGQEEKKKAECDDCDRVWDHAEGSSLECLCGGKLHIREEKKQAHA